MVYEDTGPRPVYTVTYYPWSHLTYLNNITVEQTHVQVSQGTLQAPSEAYKSPTLYCRL